MRDEYFEKLRARVHGLMPSAQADLANLVRIPSVAFAGFPRKPVFQAAKAVAAMFSECGLKEVRMLDIPGGPPAVFGERSPGPGQPTALLYAHYDVQPAGDECSWRTKPFEPAVLDGRLYGRGAADNKAGDVMHAYALKALGDDCKVGVKVLVEGDEETGRDSLAAWVRSQPETPRADAVIIGDAINVRLGVPTLTVSLRGMVDLIVDVETLESAIHSGVFGGVAPDALAATVHVLGSMFDESGSVAIDGLDTAVWNGDEYSEAEFRKDAGLVPGVDFVGRGTVGQRLWGQPSIAVVGLDVPGVATAGNALVPRVRAKIVARVAPGQDPYVARQVLVRHLQAHAPWHVRLSVTEGVATPGFLAATGGPIQAVVEAALEDAFDHDVARVGNGCSVALVATLGEIMPSAEIVLFGPMEPLCRIHSANESVSLDELERCILAEALCLAHMGDGGLDENHSMIA